MNLHTLRAGFGLIVFLAVTGMLLPCYLVAYPFGGRVRRIFAKPFFQISAMLTGLNVKISGQRPSGPGTLYVANHASYLDIPVLASLIDAQFVAKAEVKGWPLFGFLAGIANTIFVSRQASQVTRERLTIAERLAYGGAVVLFPEGSSTDGARVMPFRPGLLSAAQMAPDLGVMVQPVTIVYGPAEAGRPAHDPRRRDPVAWYGDPEMLPPMLNLFADKGGVTVEVRFHAPKPARTFADRRELARWAEDAVAGGLAAALGSVPPAQAPVAVEAPADLPGTVDGLAEAAA